MAAIGLANSTTSASWRTRHLRIRSSLLRQALVDPDAVGGVWKLIHVRGLDLVADGLTKPLFGAAFKRFLENLGMSHLVLQAENPERRAARMNQLRTGEHLHAGVASAMSLLVGQAMLTEADALEIKGEQDEADPLWIAAIVLMILGAIYAGKLAVSTAKCCIKRLQKISIDAPVVDEGEVMSCPATKDEDKKILRRRNVSCSTSSGPVQALGVGPAQSSGSRPSQTSCGGSMQISVSGAGLEQAYGSGPVQALGVGSAQSLGSGPEQAMCFGPEQASGSDGDSIGFEQALRAAAAVSESAAASGVSVEQVLLMRSREVCNDLLAEVSPSSDVAGPEQALDAAAERSFAGPEQALAAADARSSAAAERSFAAAERSFAAAHHDPVQVLAAVPPPRAAGAAVSEAVRVNGRSLKDLKNPWNLFQNENKGKGWSPQVMAAMYKQWRSSNQMP